MEEVSGHDAGTLATPQTAATANLAPPESDSVMRRFSVSARSAWRRRSRASFATKPLQQQEEELDPELVDLLDVVGECLFVIPLNTACSC